MRSGLTFKTLQFKNAKYFFAQSHPTIQFSVFATSERVDCFSNKTVIRASCAPQSPSCWRETMFAPNFFAFGSIHQVSLAMPSNHDLQEPSNIWPDEFSNKAFVTKPQLRPCDVWNSIYFKFYSPCRSVWLNERMFLHNRDFRFFCFWATLKMSFISGDPFVKWRRVTGLMHFCCSQRWKYDGTARNAVPVKELLPVRRSGYNF